MPPPPPPPSDPAITTNRLDIQKFIADRKDEIKRLENAIANSSGKKRTFQQVPRRLRRRTASHNPKRVPKRLRDRALAEFKVDQPNPPPKRRKIEVQESLPELDRVGRNELCSIPLGAKFKSRQLKNVWLPTHIWHRKRAKLTARWGFVVPTEPTQKQYRMTHRVMNHSRHAALAADTSYYCTLKVDGASAESLEARFPGCTKPLYSRRSWQGVCLIGGNPVGPALVFSIGASTVVTLHPSIYPAVFADLQTLGATLTDLRFAVGSIDLLGTRAMSALGTCFTPNSLTTAEPEAAALAKLRGLANLDLLPYHSIICFNAQDPRLKFPPSKKQHHVSTETLRQALECLDKAPATALFSDERAQSYASKSPQSELEKRKVPGECIANTAADPSIPIVVAKLDDARVRVFMPWHWVQPFWLSVVQVPNVYIFGTNQFEQLAFEQGLHQFPKDYPFTEAGAEHARQAAAAAEQSHNARPANKRAPLKESVGSPFKCEWERLGDVSPIVVTVVQRGSPKDNARIYAVPEGKLDLWLASEHKSGEGLPVGDLIGFVTSGAYNLETGMGTGVGYATVESGYCVVRNAGQDHLMLARVRCGGAVCL